MASDTTRARYAAGERACAITTAVVATAVGVAGLLGGCSGSVPERPSATSWSDDCDQQVSTVASSLAASARVLELVEDDRLPSRYAWVVLLQAEETADDAVTSASALQPPEPARAADRRVMRVLDRALAAAREARIALVAETDPSPGLVKQLSADLRRQHRAVSKVAQRTCAEVAGEGG